MAPGTAASTWTPTCPTCGSRSAGRNRTSSPPPSSRRPGRTATWPGGSLPCSPPAARHGVPGRLPRREALAPGADLRGPLDLPVLVVAGNDLCAAVRELISDLDDATIEVPAADAAGGDPWPAEEELAGHTVAVLNRGTPGCLVTPDGVMYLSLMRSCSAWPSGVWIDGERRTAPDGSSFAWQHWSHTF